MSNAFIYTTNGQSRNTSVPRINEEYITQVSEEIEGRVTKKLSQQFSRTESRILGTLSKLDEFLLNQQIRTHSGTVPGTFRNTNVENQGTNEDESQSDPHPEVGPSVCQSRHSIDSDTGEAHDTMTGVIEQTTKGPHSVDANAFENRDVIILWAFSGNIQVSAKKQKNLNSLIKQPSSKRNLTAETSTGKRKVNVLEKCGFVSVSPKTSCSRTELLLTL